jgi:quercetin dioxygenase-like cupin family protein
MACRQRGAWTVLSLLLITAGPGGAETGYPPVEVLLQSETTVIGQKIVYPEGPAQITVAIVTMESGHSTGWHVHEAPLAAHMLEGELTVDYGDDGTRTYRKGDTLIEALGSRHNGRNSGEGRARILVVFSGAVGIPNTVSE